MRAMVKCSPGFLAKLICLAAFAAGAGVVFYKYAHFSYYDWDLAFFTQASYNLVHGSQYTSLVGINYFGDHSYFFSLLLLPVFALFPHPLTLLVLKVAAFAVSGYLLYRILRQDGGQWAALAWMVLYLIFPANLFALIYEFNPEAFAPVFLLLMFDFYRREKYVPFLVSSVLLCLIKENMLLVFFMFGLYALLNRKNPLMKWAWAPMAGSMAVFTTLVFWIIPLFRQTEQHAFWVRYAHIFANPLKFLSKVVTGNLGYVGDLFGPLMVPVAAAPQSLFFVVPVFLQHMCSNEVSEHTIFYHYGPTLTPFMFLSAAAGLRKLKGFYQGKIYLAAWVLVIVFGFGHTGHFAGKLKERIVIHKDDLKDVRWEMVRKVPPDAGVVASFDFLAPLSLRRSLYSFHKLYDDFFQDPAKLKKGELYQSGVFSLPEDVTYALIDTDDPFFVREYKAKPEIISQRVDGFLEDWQVIDRRDSLLLLRRTVDNKGL